MDNDMQRLAPRRPACRAALITHLDSTRRIQDSPNAGKNRHLRNRPLRRLDMSVKILMPAENHWENHVWLDTRRHDRSAGNFLRGAKERTHHRRRINQRLVALMKTVFLALLLCSWFVFNLYTYLDALERSLSSEISLSQSGMLTVKNLSKNLMSPCQVIYWDSPHRNEGEAYRSKEFLLPATGDARLSLSEFASEKGVHLDKDKAGGTHFSVICGPSGSDKVRRADFEFKKRETHT
jgi:hypothetical protein